MTDNTVKIEVDGQEVEARKGQMLIEVTDSMDNYVPRFCYHHKLSVAANCRMCLVEVEKAPKPLPACATPVMDGMKVKTRSKLALEAQKSVMEFLLINHPLDCPICDQGGECELQDLAMGYGRDVSRYQENKRVVKDKNIGPLVQTDMTRCIHCTRCVRFGEEIAGLRELGATGRGEFMEIGTYIEKSMVSEMSGNVIDLCPVGALTSKPFRYSARAWEMTQHNGIAIHDAVGSNIQLHVKDERVMRVVPGENEQINEIWLSDRDRYSYEGLDSDDRLTVPMVRSNGEWHETGWDTAFDTVRESLAAVIQQAGVDQVGCLVSANSTTEEMYLLQKFMRTLGTANIDHRLRQADFTDQDCAPAWPSLGQTLAELETVDCALIVAGYPRKDQPIINHRLRKAALAGARVMVVNPVADEYNYDLYSQCMEADPVTSVAAILKAVQEQTGRDSDARNLIAPVTVTEQHRAMAAALVESANGTVLLGNLAMAHPQLALLRFLSGVLAGLIKAGFGYLGEAANVAGAWQAGAVPHRGCGGTVVSPGGLNTAQMLEQKLPAYITFNVDPQLDCGAGSMTRDALENARFVLAVSGYKNAAVLEHAHVLLPMALFAENEGSMINIQGDIQEQSQVVAPPGDARPGWKILRVLGNTFNLAGFDYPDLQSIRAEFAALCGDLVMENSGAWRAADSITGHNGSLLRAGYVPMNSVDALVRNARSLQQTADVASAVVQVNSRLAQRLGISDGQSVRVGQNETSLLLPLRINDAVADNCVLLHGAHPDTAALGPLAGTITVEAA